MTGIRLDERVAGAMRVLPQPLHIFAFLAAGNHYHFGCFRRRDDSLSLAQHQMCLEIAASLPPRSRVLDVGCGMGGTTRVLSGLGHQVTGIDPCREAIRFARTTFGEGDRRRFQTASFATYRDGAPGGGQRYDAIVLLEVLQHMRDLGPVWRRCVDLLRPEGVVVIADVTANSEYDWKSVPFHRGDATHRSARREGLAALERRDATADVAPTLDWILSDLERGRDRYLRFFGPFRPQAAREIHEVVVQCRHLRSALVHGDLSYEIMVFRT